MIAATTPRPVAGEAGLAGRSRARISVTGVVQGVGFRPFVYQLATRLGLSGFVGNDSAAVFIEAQGPAEALAELTRRLSADAPPLARVTRIASVPVAWADGEHGFRIVQSTSAPGARTLIPPDVATCDACLRELADPANRRYRHPFITCTDCGPRLTIIKDLPYDRPATTMAGFPMCARCAAEYHDPANRRFHAQPVSCHDCGPTLRFTQGDVTVTGSDEAIAATQRLLAEGGIVAVKGIGGYHLACRADCAEAVARLRQRKSRGGKPFAVLTRSLATARLLAEINTAERKALTSPARPIVLLRRRAGAPVADEVAPGNPLLGVLLPYTPVHHLLLAAVPAGPDGPGAGGIGPVPHTLVLTSANVSDEPLVFDDADAAQRLAGLADAVLGHDRPIHVPCDDSVVRVLPGTDGTGAELPIRRARGYAPLPVPVGAVPTVLAVGAELKNSCCLTDAGSAFCSAHIGDMGNLATLHAFERSVAQLTTVHRAAPSVIAADLHPAYLTRDWAERHAGNEGEPELRLVQHHHAHVVSLLAEHGRLGEPVIGVAFDGTGYGADGSIWGGEILLVGADPAEFERLGHLRPVPLPGGDAAVRNPCRTALAYLAAAGVGWDPALPAVSACSDAERAVIARAAAAGRAAGPGHAVSSSSMGRLFDAVASLTGVRHRIGYEAQAAIELEHLAERAPDAEQPLSEISRRLPGHGTGTGRLLPVDLDGIIDFRPLIRALAGEVLSGTSKAVIARVFHVAVADAVTMSAELIARRRKVMTVGLTGGVFQNVLLTRLCKQRLAARGFEVLTHRLVPPNDGGLALGQAVIAARAKAADDPVTPASEGVE